MATASQANKQSTVSGRNRHKQGGEPPDRVVSPDESILMHFDTPDLMQQRLEKEGIEVKKDKVVRFEKLFWDPAKELTL